MSLFQSGVAPSRVDSNTDDEPAKEALIIAKGNEDDAKEKEKNVEEEWEEKGLQQKLVGSSGKAVASVNNQSSDNGGTTSGAAAAHAMAVMSVSSLQAGQQPVRRHLLFETATLQPNTAGNLSDTETSRGLQPASQSQVLSRSSAFDAFSSFNSGVTLALRYVTAASMRSGDTASWALFASLIVVSVLVCVCFGGHEVILSRCGHDNTSTVSSGTRNRGTIWPPYWKREIPSGNWSRLCEGLGGGGPQCYNLFTPRAPPVPPAPTARSSVESTGALSMLETPLAVTSTSVVLQRRSSSHGETDAHLCPDLVVPRNCESILRIPINPMSSFYVTDFEGGRVLRVELKVGATTPQERRRVVLMTNEGIVVAQCVATPVQGGGDEFQLLRADNNYFAKLLPVRRKEVPNHPSHEEPQETWTVRACAGAEWFLFGQFGNYAVDVTDSQGRILAWSQQDAPTGMKDQHSNAGKFYLLRVASPMDISVVLCSLLAVSHLRSL